MRIALLATLLVLIWPTSAVAAGNHQWPLPPGCKAEQRYQPACETPIKREYRLTHGHCRPHYDRYHKGHKTICVEWGKRPTPETEAQAKQKEREREERSEAPQTTPTVGSACQYEETDVPAGERQPARPGTWQERSREGIVCVPNAKSSPDKSS